MYFRLGIKEIAEGLILQIGVPFCVLCFLLLTTTLCSGRAPALVTAVFLVSFRPVGKEEYLSFTVRIFATLINLNAGLHIEYRKIQGLQQGFNFPLWPAPLRRIEDVSLRCCDSSLG